MRQGVVIYCPPAWAQQGGHQQQQRAFGLMKVGDKAIDNTKDAAGNVAERTGSAIKRGARKTTRAVKRGTQKMGNKSVEGTQKVEVKTE